MSSTVPAPQGDHRPTVTAFDSQSSEYEKAFRMFLAHTEGKDSGSAHLASTVAALPRRGMFIDAGAGAGRATAALAGSFERVTAIEPSPHLRHRLVRACPQARVLADSIATAVPEETADLVLCEHVLYHVDTGQWLPTLERLASWTAPGGRTVVVLQNPDGDCMRMLRHFTGHRYDLRSLIAPFTASDIHREWRLTLTTVAATVEAPDLDTALTIAQFLLNDAPMPTPPPRLDDLAGYLQDHHRTPDGGYRLTCPQDYLHMERAT
ncbi:MULTISPECIES: class I SAM-dependent methyltransferase [unclassified Streptomyces]|uniref:class I SAM-dependent methyltransferase n=2 Tax=unclassified Streptomyces TaxID=2593676 RepID=UPI002DDB181E|nr:class I SAM-dependent methyltransferase [Streptomyces sp. NBC_01237]WRZ78536.1 class I SAM-dependent methyltransferase [Streptomyces sp. NBC_01237]